MFRELIRKNKQLSEAECIALLQTEKRGVLSVIGDHGYPYGTPMNHFYSAEEGCIYFHCGCIGHRLDALRSVNKASFCVFDSGEKTEGHWAFTVKSVIVFGRITIIDDALSIADICTKLSRKFTQDEAYIAEEITNHGHRTLLLRLDPEHMRGKQVLEA